MKYSKEIKLYGVVISVENVKKLFVLLDKYYPDYKINIKNSKGLNLTNLSKDEFLNYDFTSFRATEFSIEARDDNFNSFSLSNAWLENRIQFNYNDAEIITLIEGELKDWYNKVSIQRGLVKFLHSIWLSIILFLFASVASIVFEIKYQEYMNIIAWLSLIPILIFTLVFPIAFRALFPKIEVDIGVNYHKKFRHFVWGLLSIIIIPLIISLAV